MSSKRSRRQFVTAIAASATASLLPARAWGQTPSPPPAPSPSPSVSPSPTPLPEPSAAAEALTEVVRIRHGKHLSGADLGEIAKAIDRSLKSAERMKKVALKNSDEPDVTFFARA
jgi:hypothetical protein